MIDDKRNLIPFLFCFAKPLPDPPSRQLRYDAARQIAQVFIAGEWLDTPDAPDEVIANTKITKIKMETTDDE
ncbi:MAG: hypothetical protein ABSH28_01850 [Acidobacteriota bacterium]|jgi:hypothetical protein